MKSSTSRFLKVLFFALIYLTIFSRCGMCATFTYNFSEGWNLVSFPFTPTNPAAGDFFAGNFPVSIYTYTADGFSVVDEDTTIKPAVGYWIYYELATEMALTGTAITDMEYDYSLSKGWNLVGYAFQNNMNVDNITFDDSSIADNMPLYFYDPDQDAYFASDTVNSFSAFWVNASESGTLTINAGVDASMSPSTGMTTDTFTLSCSTDGLSVTSLEGRCDTSDAWETISSGTTKSCTYSTAGSYTPGCRVNDTITDNVDTYIIVMEEGVIYIGASVSPANGSTETSFTLTCTVLNGTATSLEGRCNTSDVWETISSGTTKSCTYSTAGSYTPGCRVDRTMIDNVNTAVTVTDPVAISVTASVSPSTGAMDTTFTLTCAVSNGTATTLEGKCDTSSNWETISSGTTKSCTYSAVGSYTPGCRVNGSTTDYVDSPVTVTNGVTISDDNTSGTAQGDTSNTGADDDDLVANSTFSDTVSIVYSGTSATITNPYNGSGVTITQDGADITVTSTIAEVAYKISGTTTSGSLKIYSDKKFKLTLSGASITNNDGPAINIQSSKTAFVVLDGTNSLTDAATYANIPDDEDAKSAFFSEGQLVFSGTGSLTVAGKYKHGIVSDDYIRVIEGTLTVTGAVKDAIHTNNYFIADGGTLNLAASSDGIDCEKGYIIINAGTFNINVADDAIVASYDDDTSAEITPNVTINGGTFNLQTSAGEGIEAKGVMTINGGTYTIETYDDGLNAIDKLYINGGKLFVQSSNNDAIDTNSQLTITGGIIIAIGSAAPEGSIDTDRNTFLITGGTVLAIGDAVTFPTAKSGDQNAVIFDGVSAGTLLHIQSSSREEALTYQVPKTVKTILYSSSKLESSKTYNIYTGGSVSAGAVNYNGLYTSGIYYSDGATLKKSFTTTTTVTQIGGQECP